ncbi:MAG: GNAT family N-acetyltransferase [Phycisphaerales bacterium]
MLSNDWIRPAAPADVPRIVEMIRGLAAHEGRPELAVCTAAAIAGALFGEPARAEAVVLIAARGEHDHGDTHGHRRSVEARGTLVEARGTVNAEARGTEHEIVGYGWLYVLVPTFLGRQVMHLEDLYIEPGARGRGLGRRFMAWLAAEAVSRGCVGVEWHVQEDNPRAIEFYEALGARRRTGALTYRLSDEALTRAAASAAAAAQERRA